MSAANLFADRVLLLIESVLFSSRDVAIVEFRHCTLLISNRAIFAAHRAACAPVISVPSTGYHQTFISYSRLRRFPDRLPAGADQVLNARLEADVGFPKAP
jgi:hypothetical protein